MQITTVPVSDEACTLYTCYTLILLLYEGEHADVIVSESTAGPKRDDTRLQILNPDRCIMIMIQFKYICTCRLNTLDTSNNLKGTSN